MTDHQRIEQQWAALDAIALDTTLDTSERAHRYFLAVNTLRDAIYTAAQRESDRAYGQGHREGRRLGYDEGWQRRDANAQGELAAVTAQAAYLRAQLADAQAKSQAEKALFDYATTGELTQH